MVTIIGGGVPHLKDCMEGQGEVEMTPEGGFKRRQRQDEAIIPSLHLPGSATGWVPPRPPSRTVSFHLLHLGRPEGPAVSANGSLVITEHRIHQLRAQRVLSAFQLHHPCLPRLAWVPRLSEGLWTQMPPGRCPGWYNSPHGGGAGPGFTDPDPSLSWGKVTHAGLPGPARLLLYFDIWA